LIRARPEKATYVRRILAARELNEKNQPAFNSQAPNLLIFMLSATHSSETGKGGLDNYFIVEKP
jgi:hypothetical protein